MTSGGSIAEESRRTELVDRSGVGWLFIALIAGGVGAGLSMSIAGALGIGGHRSATVVESAAWKLLLVGLGVTCLACGFGVFALIRLLRGAGALRHAALAGDRARSAFVTNMSHELRTPLTGILGYSELLAGDLELSDDRSNRRSWVVGIQRNGQRLLSIITDLLDMSRIESGKLEAFPERTSPAAVVEDVMSMLRVRAHEKGLLLESRIDAEVPEQVMTDPLHLRQILLTVVGNAIKFTERGGVSLRVFVLAGAQPKLRFEVRDTGIGIATESLACLFRPFSQADSSSTRRFGGMGLGLSVARKLAQILGGDIAVESELGRGSLFTIDIALVAAEALRAEGIDSGSGDRGKGEVERCSRLSLMGARVLVAEDGRENQYLISHHLRKAGASVTIAENGRLAVDAVNSQTPPQFDLILMDMQMPEMDGYTATRVLRARGCRLPIVALTAHAMPGDREKCLAAGCSDYATKPIDKVGLIGVCERAMKAEGAASARSG